MKKYFLAALLAACSSVALAGANDAHVATTAIRVAITHGGQTTGMYEMEVLDGNPTMFRTDHVYPVSVSYASGAASAADSLPHPYQAFRVDPIRYETNGDATVDGELTERDPNGVERVEHFSKVIPQNKATVVAHGIDGSAYELRVRHLAE